MVQNLCSPGHHELGHKQEQGHLHGRYDGGIFGDTQLWCDFLLLKWFEMQHDNIH